MSKIRYLSLFSGIEACTVAWEPLGWECVAVAEIEPFPSAVLQHHYPSVPNLGDVTKVTAEQIESLGHIDLVVGGSPCFTAGHLVSCVDGYKPIEDIRPGDLVRTHTGAIKPVVRVGGKVAPVGRLSGVGLPSGIVSTYDHKYRSVDYRMQNTKRENKAVRIEHCSEPDWTPAQEMVGKQWCSLSEPEHIEHQPVSRLFDAKTAMYVAGMYLGDGYIRKWSDKNKKAVTLCLNQAKLDKLSAVLGYVPTTTKSDKIFKVVFCDTLFADWLLEQFGHLSGGKHLPAWCVTHAHRHQLLQGYLDTDGSVKSNGYRINSVSKALIFGVADLAIQCGYVPSISFQATAQTTVIEGRTVQQQDYWSLGLYPEARSKASRKRHGYLLRNVQKWEPLGAEERVYNIEVADDHSYVLNGIVVKNCQDLSVAGKRKGFVNDEGNTTRSGLFFQQIRIFDIARERCGARFLVWENVVGAYSSSEGRDFAAVVSHMAGLDGVEVPKGGWQKEGAALGDNGLLEWACLDAQWFGVAQRRRRVFAVLDTGDWSNRPPILLVTQSMLRDTPPSRGPREGTPFVASLCAGGGSEPGVAISPFTQVADCLTSAYGTKWNGNASATNRDPFVAEARSALPLNTMTMQGRPSDLANPRMGSGIGDWNDPSPTLTKAHSHAVLSVDAIPYTLTGFAQYHEGVGTLKANGGDIGGGSETIVVSSDVIAFSVKDNGRDATVDLSPTMRSMGHDGSHANGGGQLGVVYTEPLALASHENQRAELTLNATVGALKCAGGKPGQGYPAIVLSEHSSQAYRVHGAHSTAMTGNGCARVADPVEVARCLDTQGGYSSNQGGNVVLGADVSSHHLILRVRRLTPCECERLQGFPDSYTAIPWKKRDASLCPDGPRYKALGNSMAVPVMAYIGRQIQQAVDFNPASVPQPPSEPAPRDRSFLLQGL